jgi:copper chaperone CopZ
MDMQTKTVTVPAISCGHCVRAIQNEVAEVQGVASVKADEQSKQVVIEWNAPATWEDIKAKLVEIDYPPQE